MTRAAAIAAVFERARATGKTVYGFGTAKASCRPVTPRDVPADFDRLAVEGDDLWTEIPLEGPTWKTRK